MKKNNRTKISYDPDADVLSYELTGRKGIDYASESGNFIVHFSKQNVPVLVELLNASRMLINSSMAVTKGLTMGHSVSSLVA